MNLHLVRRRSIWLPTLLGWVVSLAILAVPFLIWWFNGESFLALTQRQPADVMVVEGWIGVRGIRAAAVEFNQGGFRYIVVTGGLTGERWDKRRWNIAEEAAQELTLAGVPKNQIIAVLCPDAESHRTFESAVAVWATLQGRGISPITIDVFTRNSHARRSRLVFAKVFGASTKVGVISWTPPGYDSSPWWQSSERSVDFLKETVGYLFELLLNSARWSNTPAGYVKKTPTP